MGHRSRIRRVLKWAATLGCILIATLLVGSGWCWPYCQVPVGRHWLAFWAEQGVLSFLVFDPGGPSSRFITSFHLQDPSAYLTRTREPRFVWWPEQLPVAGPVWWVIRFPLWPPLVVLLVPTLWLWHRDRRIPPGHCRKCGYNLTGNVSGRCPECGTPMSTGDWRASGG
jgi:hypothetical protein